MRLLPYGTVIISQKTPMQQASLPFYTPYPTLRPQIALQPMSVPLQLPSSPFHVLLSQMLRRSLLNFQAQTTQIQPEPSFPQQAAPLPLPKPQKDENGSENGSGLNEQQREKENNSAKLPPITIDQESSVNSHLTQHEVIIPNTQRVSLSQRTRLGRPEIKVVVPEVSLVETAKMPHFGLQERQRLSKKEAVLMRQVTSWPKKTAKIKKDKGDKTKRELRMLFS